MLKPQGYGIIVDPDAPMPVEHDTITCSHCNKIVIIPPGWKPENMPNQCKGCGGWLCLGCWGDRTLGAPCVTWKQQIDRMLERAYAVSTYGLVLLLFLLVPSIHAQSPYSGATSPLTQSAVNPNYFVDTTGRPVFLACSQTWNDEQDEDNNTGSTAFDFTGYINFMIANGCSSTILWHKDLPTFCNWGAGGTWKAADNGFPWVRSATSGASDGGNKFDLTTFNTAYFTRLQTRVATLLQNGMYAVVQLFDGLGLANNRCGTTSPTGDGYPLTGVNNTSGGTVDDGYTSGSSGTGSMTMGSASATTAVQDAYVQKVIDYLNPYPNVLWETSEEAPDNSTWWQGHIISVIQTYETGKLYQHPIIFPTLNTSGSTDSTLFNANSTAIAPFGTLVGTNYRLSPTNNCSGTGTPTCKVDVNDSDHSYFNLWTDTKQVNRNWLWENFVSGVGGLYFMDPYVISWTTGSRNVCGSPSNGICTGLDNQYAALRANFGYAAKLAGVTLRYHILQMTPQFSLCSTGYCLVKNTLAYAAFVVYAPSGGAFTVNLSAQQGRSLNVQWLKPSTGVITNSGTVTGGSTTQSFTSPWDAGCTAGTDCDAVLILLDPIMISGDDGPVIIN